MVVILKDLCVSHNSFQNANSIKTRKEKACEMKVC